MGVIVVGDITSQESIKNATKWRDYIDDNIWLPNDEKLPKVLVTSKYDQIDIYKEEELDDFMQEENLNAFA